MSTAARTHTNQTANRDVIHEPTKTWQDIAQSDYAARRFGRPKRTPNIAWLRAKDAHKRRVISATHNATRNMNISAIEPKALRQRLYDLRSRLDIDRDFVRMMDAMLVECTPDAEALAYLDEIWTLQRELAAKAWPTDPGPEGRKADGDEPSRPATPPVPRGDVLGSCDAQGCSEWAA